jgi:nucleoside-triphosphatase THEP1
MRHVLNCDASLLATIALSGRGFIHEVKQRPDVEIVRVTQDNRDRLPIDMASRFRAA